MTLEVSEEEKEQILQLIATPGIELEDIIIKTNLEQDTILKTLSEEYYKCNLD